MLETGERDTGKIRAKFDEIMAGINNCRGTHFGDDAGVKEVVKNMIDKRVANIAEYFELNIDVETLTGKLDA